MWKPDAVVDSVRGLFDAQQGAYSSVRGGSPTLYGTCYALLTKIYLGCCDRPHARTTEFILGCQDPETGYFVGPELQRWTPAPDAPHSREHLLTHLTCTALPAICQFGLNARYPIRFAHRYLDLTYLRKWLAQRNLSEAWLEGNNLLFVGQLLVYLRDVESVPGSQEALDVWFEWLDSELDPRTGLWGTDHAASLFNAAYGAYHQLLVYYHERRPIAHPHRLVDVVLSLQHPDGGFAEYRGGGACADVDCVDILVNLYKLFDYRRPDIRFALRRCLRHILSLQNADGGFPSTRAGGVQSHMGIPDTIAPPGTSSMFATWFRVHTLALTSQILTDEPALSGIDFRFSSTLSMGWHRPWNRLAHQLSVRERMRELVPACSWIARLPTFVCRWGLRRCKRVLRLGR